MMEPQKRLRPDPVAVLSLLQLAKAAMLLVVGCMAWFEPDVIQPYLPELDTILWIAAHGRSMPVVVLPVFGLYMAVVGLGLWSLRAWARKNLIFTSAATVALWARRVAMAYWAQTAPFQSAAEQQAVFILLVLDLLTFFYLVMDLRVQRAFAPRNSPYIPAI
jgi:hypothetical protein